jgi:N,N'-diacetylchitobiose phosphorylase
MRYGYFDDLNREYVIERPDTPMSWVNYLGTAEYCGIISNNGAGYGFHKSPKSGRLLRFRFNSLPMDRPGRNVYLRDAADGDYWSATWQPVGKPLDDYKSTCRHGLGYSTFTSDYRDIHTKMRVFVPVDQPLEFWEVEIENRGAKARDLSLFGYAEWCFWDSFKDMLDFQYILYTCRMGCVDGIVDYSIKLWDMREPKAFFASTLPVQGFDTDRDAFIGPYRHEGTPIAVEQGGCRNSIAVGGNPCAALQSRIMLRPGEKKRVLYIVGVGDAAIEGRACRDRYEDPAEVEKEFGRVRNYWNDRLGAWQCQTPDPETNSMMRLWNQYQCHTTFNWSRAASFIESGGRDGLGYRDSNQDTLAVVHALPAQVRARLVDLLKGQLANGSAMHLVQPLSGDLVRRPSLVIRVRVRLPAGNGRHGVPGTGRALRRQRRGERVRAPEEGLGFFLVEAWPSRASAWLERRLERLHQPSRQGGERLEYPTLPFGVARDDHARRAHGSAGGRRPV